MRCIENAVSFCLFSETYYDKTCLECDIIILIFYGLEMPWKWKINFWTDVQSPRYFHLKVHAFFLSKRIHCELMAFHNPFEEVLKK